MISGLRSPAATYVVGVQLSKTFVRVFFGVWSRTWVKFQCVILTAVSSVKRVLAVLELEDDSVESQKSFYILSIMLLISLLFLSPDKIPQTLAPGQTDVAISDAIQAILKAVKRILPI